ncbi:MAG: hypothetical protein IJF41_01585 [Clostridia bacterium]|nr:hypothetical protein [Clostridia bacterium]
MKAKGSGIAVFLEKIALIITLLAFLAVTLAGCFVTCRIEIDCVPFQMGYLKYMVCR